MALDRPRLSVDFNEMQDQNTVLLSKVDLKVNSNGETVEPFEGLLVYIYEADTDCDDEPNYLLAQGICKRNKSQGWSKVAKWVCEIDDKGINHQF